MAIRHLLLGMSVVTLSSPTGSFAQENNAYSELPEFIVVGEPPSDEDAAAVRRVLGILGQGWGAGDAEMVSSVYSDNAEWMNAFGQIRRGSAAIEEYLADLWDGEADDVAEGEQRDEQPISLRYLGDDVAIYHGVTKSRRAGALEGAGDRRVHSTFVLEKVEGEWMVVHHHISDARPAVP
ncbi:MAG: SgcJ/EcaC family oxidoreductase [Parvularcula sp.]|jgi:uncharacterized protein (TIGR02246 family)|nr:SgcJ/EcaC family oxidoreductase [Parvularcula sp.]